MRTAAMLAVLMIGSLPVTARAVAGDFDHSHRAWSELLARYVSDGSVDYGAWKAAGESELAGYASTLGAVTRAEYESWTREQKLAFWINAYNAYTVALILEHYPLETIRSIGLLPGAAFRKPFITMKNLRDEKISLNDIEHEILRKEFVEPRIHFAIVCASKGCPALRPEAFRAADLDEQLDAAARDFVRDSRKNRFDAESRTLYLSSIFDWFHEDFEKAAGNLPSFVARYSEETVAAAIATAEPRVKFLDYDWSLNGR